ncbi:MAG: [FeFe] hydrogenase, group A [Oscillospiraceae bacterium]|jgi:NADH-quinone oxidoreductase subunit G|nr:[FeFe] hydrogenase, group A [Oscillospiraceae bacterium]
MVNLTINKKPVSVPEGTSIIDAARSNGIGIPSLCYFKGLNEIGACRVCAVEIEKKDKLVPACNTPVEEGMAVFTNSPKAREARRTNVELILSQHDCLCAKCARSGNCALQTVANDLNIIGAEYEPDIPEADWPADFPLIRSESKCIKCMRCVQTCDKIQNLQVWDVINTGSRTTVGVKRRCSIEKANCSLCGQCITHCPTGALRERDDTDKVFAALADPDKITIVQIAPAIRTAWCEAFGLSREEGTVERLAACLRRVGFDYVFDTTFSADLTITEEASEFIGRFTKGGLAELPMFTSCCPGWVRFVKSEYPELLPQLSSAKSPQQMFGAAAKTWFAKRNNIDPHRIFNVSIMPCLAKKFECSGLGMNDACGDPDVDVVLTNREVTRLLRMESIDPRQVEPEPCDMPLGIGTGAGEIFGATGGVMEAALRSAYFYITGENPPPDAFKDVRGMDGWKESAYKAGEVNVRVAVVNGLANARRLIEALLAKKVSYDFVEVMACPGGCVGGGGQPVREACEMAPERFQTLYDLDKKNALRFSHENPSVIAAYSEYFEKPNSHAAHKLLHIEHKL